MKDLEFVADSGGKIRLTEPNDISRENGEYLAWSTSQPSNSQYVHYGGSYNTPKLRQFLRRALARLERDAEKKRGKKCSTK